MLMMTAKTLEVSAVIVVNMKSDYEELNKHSHW